MWIDFLLWLVVALDSSSVWLFANLLPCAFILSSLTWTLIFVRFMKRRKESRGC